MANGPIIEIWMSRPDWREMGGPVSHLPVLIDRLERRPQMRLRTFVYGGRKLGPLPRKFSEFLPVKVLLTFFDWFKFLLMLLIHERPHIIHLNSVFDYFGILRDLPYLAVARLLGVPCLVKTHGSNEFLIRDQRRMVHVVRSWHLRLVSAITLLSPVETAEFQAIFPQYASKFHTAKNIVQHGTLRGKPKAQGTVLFAGRFVEKKNIPALFSAVAKLLAEGVHLELLMAGDGPMRAELQALAAKLDIEAQVKFLGWLDQSALLKRIAESGLVVFCSHGSEGMPMIIIETLRTDSLLLVAPQRFTESYNLRDCGVIYLDNDTSEELAAGVRGAMGGRVSAQELLARDAFFLQFSAQRVTDEFCELYFSLLPTV